MYLIKHLLKIVLLLALLNISAEGCGATSTPSPTPLPTAAPIIGQYSEEEFIFRDGVDIWGVAEGEKLHIACIVSFTLDAQNISVLDCKGVRVALSYVSPYIRAGEAYSIQGVYTGRMIDIDTDNNPIYWPIVWPRNIVHLPKMEEE